MVARNLVPSDFSCLCLLFPLASPTSRCPRYLVGTMSAVKVAKRTAVAAEEEGEEAPIIKPAKRSAGRPKVRYSKAVVMPIAFSESFPMHIRGI